MLGHANARRDDLRRCPNCERSIAGFAYLKYSERIGGSTAAKPPDQYVVRLAAIIAHVRHEEMDYDELLGRVNGLLIQLHLTQCVAISADNSPTGPISR